MTINPRSSSVSLAAGSKLYWSPVAPELRISAQSKLRDCNLRILATLHNLPGEPAIEHLQEIFDRLAISNYFTKPVLGLALKLSPSTMVLP
jgi:hypothetical protein